MILFFFKDVPLDLTLVGSSHPVEASVCVVCQEVMEAKEDIRVFGGPDVEAQTMKEERLMADVQG